MLLFTGNTEHKSFFILFDTFCSDQHLNLKNKNKLLEILVKLNKHVDWKSSVECKLQNHYQNDIKTRKQKT